MTSVIKRTTTVVALRKLTLATVAVAAVMIAAVAIALPAPPDGTALA